MESGLSVLPAADAHDELLSQLVRPKASGYLFPGGLLLEKLLSLSRLKKDGFKNIW